MRFSSALKLALTITLLEGCAPATVQTYEGPPRDRSQVSVLKGISAEYAGTGRTYYLFFVSYSVFDPDRKPSFNKVGDSFTGYPKELTMLPGRYLVMTRCATGNEYAFPSVLLAVAAGEEYEVKCEPVADRLSRVRAVARKVGAARDAQESVPRDKLDSLLPLLK